MIQNHPRITSLMYDSMIEKMAIMHDITLEESKIKISKMSFSRYLALLEAATIVPPSGQAIGGNKAPAAPTTAIGPTGPSATPQSSNQPVSGKPQSLWAGQGTPITQGMTVGLTGPDGKHTPGEITQVDQSASGVKVRNPTTGREEWHSNDDLQQYQDDSAQQVAENRAIARMRHLAGISEDASCGASSAGSIAIAPSPAGQIKRRQPVDEQPKEHIRTSPAETIIGDTKPNQASGELSANLAARNKKTATRANNGLRR